MINKRYLIKKKLGEGRSKVYLCSDLDSPGQDTALKILPRNAGPEELKVFRDEYFTLRKLDHPNIIKAGELGIITFKEDEDPEITEGSSFIAMEYFEGKGLTEYAGLKDETALKEIARQTAAALYYLHQSNFIYYDLKPDNILVADVNGSPQIKLIDLGFCQYTVDNEDSVIRGSAEYIAPEILRKEEHDHRVDFYSLGMMLYKIVYGSFPFETGDEIEIYKAHVEKEFEFPESRFSKDFISLIKKLLSKDPNERFDTGLSLIDALGFEIEGTLSNNWVPAKVFADRLDVLNIVRTYIGDETSGEVFALKGFEGSGKSSLLNEIHNRFENTVLIRNNKSRSGADFIRFLVKQIVFTGGVYGMLSRETVQALNDFFNSESSEYINELKSLITAVAKESDFILLLDGFNLYDDFSVEVFKNIIPILQVEKIKVILSETSDYNYKSDFIFNLREIDLKPFTDTNLSEYLTKAFYDKFPREDLKKLILMYADLLPGNVESFIKDIILLGIIKFDPSGIKISDSGNTEATLKKSHEEIYALRLESLSEEEFETAKFISSFDISVDRSVISEFFEIEADKTRSLLENLQYKNILQQFNRSSEILFTSDGLKNYIYSTIKDKGDHHLKIAKSLSSKFNSFNRIELARQYDLANKFKESYEILKLELASAEKLSAYSYQERLLKHLSNFPLEDKDKFEITWQLCQVYFKLSNFRSALNLVDELLEKKPEPQVYDSILTLKGSSLVGLGENESGIELLNSLIPHMKDEEKKQGLLVEIAGAEFDLNRFNSASEKCTGVINNPGTALSDRAKSFNLLGLIALYRTNNFDEALTQFQKAEELYQNTDLKFRLAQMQMNIGNIYNMKGEYSKAEVYWNKSLGINQSVGNLDQEARLFLNFGIFHYNQLNFDKSVESYTKAFQIFSSLGNMAGQGSVQTNLGEIFLLTCDYQKALDSLNTSIRIFTKLQNTVEVLEAQFIKAKLFLIIGDDEQLGDLLNDFENKLDNSNKMEIYVNHLNYLKQLQLIISSPGKVDIDELRKIREIYYEREDKFHYFGASIAIIQALLNNNLIEDTFNELSSDEFSDLCIRNLLFNAERNYWMARLAEIGPDITMKSPIEYYLTSYNILRESSITELTWKVMYEIGSIYFNRGNYAKAKEYLNYSESLIKFIAENNFNNANLRKIYLNQIERKKALDQIEEYGSRLN